MKTLTRDTILQAISEEKLGFKFGKPERTDDSSLAVVLPILRKTKEARAYTTYPEAEEKVVVRDTGIIDRMEVENEGDEAVFIRSGTIFKGKTQERALVRSAILFPGQKAGLNVRCVHQSRGIQSGAKGSYGGLTPLNLDQRVYRAGFTGANQGEYWGGVTRSVSLMAAASGRKQSDGVGSSPYPVGHISRIGRDPYDSGQGYTGQRLDDLSSAIGDFSATFDQLLSKVVLHKNQSGIALITDQGCQTIEAFDIPMSWEAIHKDAVGRMGTEILRSDKESVFEYKADNAVKAVRKILGLNYRQNTLYEHKPKKGEPRVVITGLTAEKYVGEVAELDGRVIHLVLLRQKAA